ncbi:carbohydrate ABC transporter permease [Haloarcula sp. GH36]|uniref:carbohydrate ABC transporter permease n=1 Tax=Haloarcula montana TaxID=3111776 RepID=UPI002D79886E|nr:carbohydrate ABC transporter permease [Haloarcula sp. GH36]
MHQETKTEALWRFGGYGFLVVAALFMLVPIYWIVVASTLPQSAILSSSGALPQLSPGGHFLENFQALQSRQYVNFLNSVWNSIFIAVVYTVLALFLCSMAGFAFAKYEFRFKEVIFTGILATLVIPINLLVIPLFLVMSTADMTNTYAAIILPWAAYPVGIFFMRQSMQAIPDALLESARMDGASEFQLYYRVALPSMKSSMAALAVILFLFQWNMFLWPLVVLGKDKFTIPVAITKIMGQQIIAFDQLMVASAIAILPMFVVFLALQKYFVRGILSGAVKE